MLEFISAAFLWGNTSYSLLFPDWSNQKRFIFVLQRDEPEG